MDEFQKYAQIAIKNLKKYTGIFSIGEPTLKRFQGNMEWHQSKPEKARQLWRAAIEKAHSFPMKYEEARASLELGRHLDTEIPSAPKPWRMPACYLESVVWKTGFRLPRPNSKFIRIDICPWY